VTRKLATTADLKLPKRVGEVGLNRAQCDVKLLGDFPVSVPRSSQRGYAVLGGGERPGPGEQLAPRPCAGSPQLAPRSLSEESESAALG
jgi:hypothetical protein